MFPGLGIVSGEKLMLNALSATSVTEMASKLGQVSQLWLDPAFPLRCESISALQICSRYSPDMIDRALTVAFSELTEDKLLAYCAEEPEFERSEYRPKSVLHILAGNVFSAWLPGAYMTLLLGSRCLLKPSIHEPVFAPLWKRSLELVDRALAQRIQMVRWEESLLHEVDAVVAYGSDETIDLLRKKTPRLVRFIGYAHKYSIAIISREAWTENREYVINLLKQDILPFDLGGCLSPQIIFWEGDDPEVLDSLRFQVSVMPQIQ
jgi:hypothetical protein